MSLGINPQVKGVPDDLYKALDGSHLTSTVDTIVVPDRERPLDEATVQKIYDSIENTGLHQPIGIRTMKVEGKIQKHLIWGYHRFEAWRRKFEEAFAAGDEAGKARWHQIPVMLYDGENMSDDVAKLIEIQENLDRKELTSGEREAAIAKRAKLLGRIRPKSAQKTKSAQNKKVHNVHLFRPPSMVSISGGEKGSGVYGVLRRRYNEYRDVNHKKPWNKQTKVEYNAFLTWLEGAEERERKMKEEKERQASLEAEEKRIAIEAKASEKRVDTAAKAIRDCTDAEALKAIEEGGKGNLLPD